MVKKDMMQALIGEFEGRYYAAKKGEAETLHNALSATIGEHKPDVQILLFVLEMLKFECMTHMFGKLFMEGGRPPLDIKPMDE